MSDHEVVVAVMDAAAYADKWYLLGLQMIGYPHNEKLLTTGLLGRLRCRLFLIFSRRATMAIDTFRGYG